MITHKLYGGLGNQLFQIYTVIALSLKSGHEFYFEWNDDCLLVKSSIFKHIVTFCKSSEECRALERHLQIQYIREPKSQTYDYHLFDRVFMTDNHETLFVLEGYFQSYLYFQNEFNKISNMLFFSMNKYLTYGKWAEGKMPSTTKSSGLWADSKMPSTTNFSYENYDRELPKVITETSTTITMHFRLGDYKYLQHTHVILPCNYYRNALNYIIQKNQLTMNHKSINVVYVFQKDDKEIVENYYIQRLARWFPQCKWISIYSEPDINSLDRQIPSTTNFMCENAIVWSDGGRSESPSTTKSSGLWSERQSHSKTNFRVDDVTGEVCNQIDSDENIHITEKSVNIDEHQLLYMALSKYHIMANSTFSLWSAYLNINENPCICYPKYWFTNTSNDILWKANFFSSNCPENILMFYPGNYFEIYNNLNPEDMFFSEWNQIDMELNHFSDDVYFPNVDIQCLCYKNAKKHENMTRRFETVGLPLRIFSGVSFSDNRILNFEKRKNTLAVQRLWSVTYGHLDMIQRFIQTNKPFGIFCEDDILVNRTLPTHLFNIIDDFTDLKLDILLLGYMTTHKIEGWMADYKEITCENKRPYTYHNYPENQWGVHMYMLSRKGAKEIIKKYMDGYADNPENIFSPDWTISKCPGLKRAIIYPMFAVEDGADLYEHYDHSGQYNFHMDTFKFNYIPEVFI